MRFALSAAITIWGVAALAQTAHEASRGLEPVMRELVASIAGSEWIGYTVPGVKGSPEQILVRVEERRIRAIRLPGQEWKGLEFRPQHSLAGVRPGDSVRWLEGWVRDPNRQLSSGALAALSMHAGSEADDALERCLAPTEPEALRKHVAFWLGAERGAVGVERLKRLLREDSSEQVREQAVFALSVSKDPAAFPALLDVVRQERSGPVRKKAMFWLARSKDPRASEFLDKLFQQ